ncbi:sensor histidine kinase [Blastococcus sp. SYSU DS0552]
MTLAVLDRPRDNPPPWTRRLTQASAWQAAVRGPLPCTVLLTAVALLLLTGDVPVVHQALVHAGLAVAVAATGVAWFSRSRSLPGSFAVPVAQLAAAGLLYAGTASATTLVLLLGPLWALATHADRRGVLLAVAGTTAVLAGPSLVGPLGGADDLPGALLVGPLAVAVGSLAVNESTRRAAAQARHIARLQQEQAALLTQVRSRADELDTASRILAARAQTMTSVIDAVTEQSIIGTDRDGTIRVWNPGAEKMLGVPRPDVVRTRSILDFHLPAELDAAAADGGCGTGLEALVRVAREHGSDVRDWTYVAADGSHRTVSVAITPRSDDRGVHAGWNFVGTDMTEARATERMKDQFVSLISHELRTPLSSILGYLELVMDDEDSPLTDEQRQYLSTVERNAQRLLRLVGDLLFTAQVESGRFTLQPADVDLAGVVRAAEETARVAAGNAGVRIVVDVPGEGMVVSGDAVRLGQACDNLVSNAVKFTPAGGEVRLVLRSMWRSADGEVRAHPAPGAEPVAQLSVSDTGMGIPAGEQGQLFTRFFRSSTAQRNAVPGVGLGLTITKAITTAHGGTLDLVSTEGVGTTFTMTLPATPAG